MSDKAEAFNAKYPIGTPVRYWPGAKIGAGTASVTRRAAWMLGGHSAVVSVEGYAGGIALTHIEVTA